MVQNVSKPVKWTKYANRTNRGKSYVQIWDKW